MTDGLIAFLWARLNEDEAMARATTKRQPYDEWDAVGAGTESDGHRSHWEVVRIAKPFPTPAAHDIAQHIARHDPDRVLREIQAKRAIVAKYEYWNSVADKDGIAALSHWHRGERHGWWNACRMIAAVYADHPDYRKEWAIEGRGT